MRYFALAADFDGTIARNGVVDTTTIAALTSLRESGRKSILVTGRILEDLRSAFDHLELFDRVVLENGAVLYNPVTKETRLLAEPPPGTFSVELKKRGVPIAEGRVILATCEPHQETVLAAIRDLGLEMHLVFNKGAVMVVPSGVNKATGLKAALAELGLSPLNVVGVGDAENDHALLSACACAVAVFNALPAVKEHADWTTEGDHGTGVTQLIERMIADDLNEPALRPFRNHVRIGVQDDGLERRIDPQSARLLICGTSGGGKSTLVAGLLEAVASVGYQYVIFDPEGDYQSHASAVVLGNGREAPTAKEILDFLAHPEHNAVLNLLGTPLDHRPGFFLEVLPGLLELRARTGRPHLIVIDEAHHLLPTRWSPSEHVLPETLEGVVLITVHPAAVCPALLKQAEVLLVVGQDPGKSLAEFCETSGEKEPTIPEVGKLLSGEALFWSRGLHEAIKLRIDLPKTERTRHLRKYSEGNLGPERSFRFRGPEGKLNLKAHNLVLFLQMADGVDDETWEYHRLRGEYSEWLRDSVKNEAIAEEVAAVEKGGGNARESREAIRAAIERVFTLPSDAPTGKIDN